MHKITLPKALQPSMRLYFFVLILFAGFGFLFRGHWILMVICEGSIIVLLLIFTIISDRKRKRELVSYIENITDSVGTAARDNMVNFPVPAVIYNISTDRILWSNTRFAELSGEREHLFEINLSDVIPDYDGTWLSEGNRESPRLTSHGGRKFKVFGSIIRSDRTNADRDFLAVTYWVDVTEFADTYEEYTNSRPVAAQILLDNYDELLKGLSEKDKSALLSSIDDRITEWASGCGGFLTKSDRDRYLFIFEDRFLPRLEEGRFSVLDSVRELTGSGGVRATLSIGLGKGGESFDEIFRFASLSLEMALSRGGDQVVLKDALNFTFYDSHSEEQGSSSSVRSRVMSGAFAELVKDASMVLVMGHKLADLDAVGAAAGVCCIARKQNIPCRIVVNREASFASQLVEKLEVLPEYEGVFISAQEAILMADSGTLLTVVDTNRPSQVESESLLISCNRVAVIDHHRRAADYIEKPDLNFHEPGASSACELLCELLQYIAEPADILPAEADAMLSGIVLDTKSFTIRTHSRTFDAAAFLERCGANTASVKLLLQSDMTDARLRYSIISEARDYGNGIALAVSDIPADRVVIAKAADELLNISGITTSFVLSPVEGGVAISGRGIGDVDVQQILEALGGGGNRSTAGVQLSGITSEEACGRLTEAVDAYLARNNIAQST